MKKIETWVYLWSINSMIRPTFERSVLLSVALFILISFDDMCVCVFRSIHAMRHAHTSHTHFNPYPSIGIYCSKYIAILGYYLSLKYDPIHSLWWHFIAKIEEPKIQYKHFLGTKLQKHLTDNEREIGTNKQMDYTKNQWSSFCRPPFDHNTRTQI